MHSDVSMNSLCELLRMLQHIPYRSHRNSPRKTSYFERCVSEKTPLVGARQGARGVPARSVNFIRQAPARSLNLP